MACVREILLVDDKYVHTSPSQFARNSGQLIPAVSAARSIESTLCWYQWIDAAIQTRLTSCGAFRRAAKRLSGSMICTLVTSILLFRYRTAYRCRQVHQLPRSNELASLGPRASRARSRRQLIAFRRQLIAFQRQLTASRRQLIAFQSQLTAFRRQLTASRSESTASGEATYCLLPAHFAAIAVS